MKKQLNLEELVSLINAGIDLTTEQAAIYLNKSPRTLEKYRVEGGGPPFIKYQRCVRYPIQHLKDWKNARIKNNTSEQ